MKHSLNQAQTKENENNVLITNFPYWGDLGELHLHMNKRLLFLVFIFLVIFCNPVKSQYFEVPENYELNTKEDYAKYEKDVVDCVNWMENSPFDKDGEKWTNANTFLLKWLAGSSTVNIKVNSKLVIKDFDKNPQFMILFLAGWTRYSLKNNYSNDPQRGYVEGFKTVIKVYKKGIGIVKTKDMDHLIKIFDKGKLENWIKKNVK